MWVFTICVSFVYLVWTLSERPWKQTLTSVEARGHDTAECTRNPYASTAWRRHIHKDDITSQCEWHTEGSRLPRYQGTEVRVHKYTATFLTSDTKKYNTPSQAFTHTQSWKSRYLVSLAHHGKPHVCSCLSASSWPVCAHTHQLLPRRAPQRAARAPTGPQTLNSTGWEWSIQLKVYA